MSTSPEDSPQSLYQSSGRDILPIILDASQSPISSSDLAEQVNQDGSLLDNTGVSAALLSMSGYGKTYAGSEGYDSNNPANMYLAYAQPAIKAPHMQSHPSYSRNPNQGYSDYTQRNTTQENAPTWSAEQPQQTPEVISWSPKLGSHGSKVFINLRSTFLIDTNTMFVQVQFGAAKGTNLVVTNLKDDGAYYQYCLQVHVPAHSLTGCYNYEVPVTVTAQGQSGDTLASLKLDEPFGYAVGSLQPSPSISRKRRLSTTNEDSYPAKRVEMESVKLDSSYDNRSYSYPAQTTGYIHSSPHTTMATPIPTYSRPMSHPGDLQHNSPSHLHSQINSIPASQPRQPAHVRSWSSSHLGGSLTKSPNMSGATRRMDTMSSSPSVGNPRLVRTSQISQSPSPAPTPAVVSSASNFNPYAMYPHKASLKLVGDLETMTENWTPDERDCKRRLVQFWRSQNGSTINAEFAPVAPENRPNNSICISCIWWEEKNQYFVTSVDTIFLLESLVAVRFTVEEKNRIRRNLEGFRPSTVSKGKADSEEFFKLIMGFPNPKPRNIEKDVKVYSWKILGMALKKIIGKYSASYSSVAANMNPTMNSYNSPQDMANDLTPPPPHSTVDASLSMAYHSPMSTVTSMPPNLHHSQSTTSGYTTSVMLPSTIAPSYPLYSYPQSQSNHSSALLNYPSQQTSQQQQQHHPTTWDNSISLQQTAPVSAHGMYTFGSGSHGLDQYQINHSNSGS